MKRSEKDINWKNRKQQQKLTIKITEYIRINDKRIDS